MSSLNDKVAALLTGRDVGEAGLATLVAQSNRFSVEVGDLARLAARPLSRRSMLAGGLATGALCAFLRPGRGKAAAWSPGAAAATGDPRGVVQPVGTKCGLTGVGSAFGTGWVYGLTRTRHVMPVSTGGATDIQPVFGNWVGAAFPEANPYPLTVGAAIEYGGKFYLCTFRTATAGASPQLNCALVQGGQMVIADPVACAIPPGATYYIRTLMVPASTSAYYPVSRNTFPELGEWVTYATSGTAPQTAHGADLVTNAAAYAGGVSTTLPFASTSVTAFGSSTIPAGAAVSAQGMTGSTNGAVVGGSRLQSSTGTTLVIAPAINATVPSGTTIHVQTSRVQTQPIGGYGPLAILGRVRQRSPSLLLFGDSIGAGKDNVQVPITTAATAAGSQNAIQVTSLNIDGGAVLAATVSGGVVTAVSVTTAGTGLTTNTAVVQFLGGSPTTPAVATAVISGGGVASVTVTSGGAGYQSTPTVVISAGVLCPGLPVPSYSASGVNAAVPVGAMIGTITGTSAPYTITLVDRWTGLAANLTGSIASGVQLMLGMQNDALGNIGYIEKGLVTGFGTSAIAPAFPLTSVAVSGDMLFWMYDYQNGVQRMSILALGFSHVGDEYAVNDISSGSYASWAAYQATKNAFWAEIAAYGATLIAFTATPEALSSDAFVSVGNQVPKSVAFQPSASPSSASQTAMEQQLNDYIRSKPVAGMIVVDTADAAMSARNSQLWSVMTINGGTYPRTLDGVHPIGVGQRDLAAAVNAALVTSGAIHL